MCLSTLLKALSLPKGKVEFGIVKYGFGCGLPPSLKASAFAHGNGVTSRRGKRARSRGLIWNMEYGMWNWFWILDIGFWIQILNLECGIWNWNLGFSMGKLNP